MEDERNPGTDPKPSQWSDIQSRVVRLVDEATGHELYQWVRVVTVREVSPCREVSQHQWEVAVTLQWEDGAEQELFQREQRVQELPQGENEASDPKKSLWGEENVSSQQLSQGGEGPSAKNWDRPLPPEKDKEPCEPLAPEGEKTPESPALSEEVPGAGAHSQVSAPHSPCCCPSTSPTLLGAQSPREEQEGDEGRMPLAEKGSEEGTSAGRGEDREYLTQLQLSQEHRSGADSQLSQGEVSNSKELSDWDEYIEPELSHGEVGDYREPSDWEVSINQGVSKEEDSVGQDSAKHNGNRPSVQSSWEDDSDITRDTWEQGSLLCFVGKALLREDDDWDELSVLELCEEGRAPSLAALAAEGLAVPVPREAWVEGQAAEPLCASPAPLQGPVAHAASPALARQGPEAGPQSPGPASHSPPSPSAPRPAAQAPRQQPAPPRKRPSRLRRALWALRGLLFRCPCLAPRPQE